MRLVVVGAAGFVGANLVRAWSSAGHEVVAVMRPGSDEWRLDGADCERRHLDLAGDHDVSSMVRGAVPHVVVNCAAHGAYSRQTDTTRMLAVNAAAVRVLAEQCRTHRVPLLHLGSSSEYGTPRHASSETDRLSPNSSYAVSKAAGTHFVCDAVERGLVGGVFRLYSVYGPWEDPGRLMPTLARHVLDGLLPPLVDPRVARDFVHVDDVVAAVTAWVHSLVELGDPPVVNIGSGVQTTIGELVELIQSRWPTTTEPSWGSMPNRSWDTTTWVGNQEKALQVLEWRATTSIAAGFEDLMRFVAEHRDRYQIPDAT